MELFQSITDTKQIQRQTNRSVSTIKSTVGSQVIIIIIRG